MCRLRTRKAELPGNRMGTEFCSLEVVCNKALDFSKTRAPWIWLNAKAGTPNEICYDIRHGASNAAVIQVAVRLRRA